METTDDLMKCLYDFQLRGVKFHQSHHYSINGCKMGLGKTIQAIALIAHTDKPVCIVCPAYLRQNWQNEIDKFLPKTFTAPIFILSYEKFRRSAPQCTLGVLVFDEAHYLKNIGSKRAGFAHEYVKSQKPERLLLLTGTPVQNRVTEFFSLLKLCSYNPKGTSGLPLQKGFSIFATALCYVQTINTPYGHVKKYNGLKNKPLLVKYMRGKYFTATHDKRMPEIFRQDIVVDAIANKELVEELEEDFTNNHISTAKANIALEKTAYTVKYILDCAGNEELPILVFSDHVEPCFKIKRALESKTSLRVTVITGDVDPHLRSKFVKEFQLGKIDVLVGTIGSMSTGFTLTATNRVVFNDLSWIPANNEQAEKRIHRIGQTKDCYVVRILSEGIDRKIVEVLEEKQSTLDKVYSS